MPGLETDFPMTDAAPPTTDHPPARWGAVLLFLLVVVLLPATTTAIAVDRFPALSKYDEFAHIDYLRRIDRGEVPRIGDKILPETARDVACRTINGREVVPCSLEEIPLEVIDAQGYSYEAQQPPLYYAATSVVRRVFGIAVNGYVNAARLTGMVWLSAGLAVLWWFFRRRLGAPATVTAVACALVGLAPVVVGQAGIVNNDAAGVLIGSVVLVGYERGRRPLNPATLLVMSAVAVVLVLVKPLAVLPIGASVLALLFGSERAGQRWLARAQVLVPAAAAAVTYQAWQLVRDAREVVPYADVVEVLLGAREILDGYPFHALGVYSSQLLTAFDSGGASYVAGAATTIGLLFVYTPTIATALGHGARELRALQASVVAVAIVAPMLLLTQSYFQVQRGGGANARYAIALIPMMVTALAGWLEDKGNRRLAAVAAGVLFVVTMIALLTEDPA
ncbi:MAG: hypothetical protein ACLGI8_15555 [Acidimicrobiia bacterium]|jgi:hypothetical protein